MRVSSSRTMLIATAVLGWLLLVWPRVVNPDQRAWDFLINRAGAGTLQAGGDPYHGSARTRFSQYIGPPSTGLLYLPFTFDPAERAALVYRVVVSFVFAVAVFVGGLAVPRDSRTRAWGVGAAALVLWHPVFASVRLGQVDAWIVLALASSVVAASRARWFLAGIGVGAAAMLKTSPATVLIFCLADRRRWPAIAGAVITAAIIAAATLPLFGLAPWRTFVTSVAPILAQGTTSIDNQSVPAVLARVLAPARHDYLGPWAWFAPAIAITGALGVARACRRRPSADALGVGATMLVALLAGPITWNHYETWALVPLVAAADATPWRDLTIRHRRVALTIGAASACLFVAQVSPQNAGFTRVLSQAGTVGVLGMLATVLVLIRGRA